MISEPTPHKFSIFTRINFFLIAIQIMLYMRIVEHYARRIDERP